MSTVNFARYFRKPIKNLFIKFSSVLKKPLLNCFVKFDSTKRNIGNSILCKFYNINTSPLLEKQIIWGINYSDIEDTQEVVERYTNYKKVYTLLFIVLSLIILGGIYKYYDNNIKIMIQDFDNKDSIYWLNNFVKCNYDACDGLMIDEENKIYNSGLENYLDDEYFYTIMLKSISKGIEDISIESYERTDTEIKYNIVLKYKPFEKISNLTITDKQLEEFKTIKSEYKEGSLEISKAASRYKVLYKEIYKDNCLKYSDGVSTLRYTIKEKINEDGLVDISDNINLLYKLIDNTNALNNIGLFQQSIIILMQRTIDEN